MRQPTIKTQIGELRAHIDAHFRVFDGRITALERIIGPQQGDVPLGGHIERLARVFGNVIDALEFSNDEIRKRSSALEAENEKLKSKLDRPKKNKRRKVQ
jgi:hypothetical protein